VRRVHGRACWHHSLPVRAAWPGVAKWRPPLAQGCPLDLRGAPSPRGGRGRAAVALCCLAKVADSVAIWPSRCGHTITCAGCTHALLELGLPCPFCSSEIASTDLGRPACERQWRTA
jgi:hypothetical protein